MKEINETYTIDDAYRDLRNSINGLLADFEIQLEQFKEDVVSGRQNLLLQAAAKIEQAAQELSAGHLIRDEGELDIWDSEEVKLEYYNDMQLVHDLRHAADVA